jgi:hypothetical protein
VEPPFLVGAVLRDESSAPAVAHAAYRGRLPGFGERLLEIPPLLRRHVVGDGLQDDLHRATGFFGRDRRQVAQVTRHGCVVTRTITEKLPEPQATRLPAMSQWTLVLTLFGMVTSRPTTMYWLM